eukprot:768426-Hanusia_phi.AAC.5
MSIRRKITSCGSATSLMYRTMSTVLTSYSCEKSFSHTWRCGVRGAEEGEADPGATLMVRVVAHDGGADPSLVAVRVKANRLSVLLPHGLLMKAAVELAGDLAQRVHESRLRLENMGLKARIVLAEVSYPSAIVGSELKDEVLGRSSLPLLDALVLRVMRLQLCAQERHLLLQLLYPRHKQARLRQPPLLALLRRRCFHIEPELAGGIRNTIGAMAGEVNLGGVNPCGKLRELELDEDDERLSRVFLIKRHILQHPRGVEAAAVEHGLVLLPVD